MFIPSVPHHLDWYRKMMDLRDHGLSPEDREALEQWEVAHVLEGDMVITDWPGWEQRLGPPPWKSRRSKSRLRLKVWSAHSS